MNVNRIYRYLCWILLINHAGLITAQDNEGIEIIQDMYYQKGFSVTPLHPSIVQEGGGFAATYVDTLDFGIDNLHPVWRVAQWHSKYSLEGVQPVTHEDGSIVYTNEGKQVGIFPDSSLLLEVNASQEYADPRENGEPWPHLLISQDFNENSPNVGEMAQLIFSMDLKLVKGENKMEEGTYNPSLHTAHSPFYFILRNDNKNSSDYNQKIWFGFPSYDYRHTVLTTKEKIHWDIGTSTYIYSNPAQDFWGNVNFHDKNWHHGEADIKPMIIQALNGMKDKGLFLNTLLSDLKLTYMNFGWEVPGTFDAALRVKNISLKAIPYIQPPKPKYISLLKDESFNNGFAQRGPVVSRDTVDILMIRPGKRPFWLSSQWASDYVLRAEDLEILSAGSYTFENEGNRYTRILSGDGVATFSMYAAGQKEWADGVRKPGEQWPHMLLSQPINNCPTLDRLHALNFSIETRVKEWRIYFEDQYNSNLHAARYRTNIVVKNINPQSTDFNEYFWFVLTYFDNRHEFMPESWKLDGGSGMFIYSANARDYLSASTHGLDWVTIDRDILPLIKIGLEKGKDEGFFEEAAPLSDFTIVSFNIGYELTGAIEIESQIRNLSIVAVEK